MLNIFDVYFAYVSCVACLDFFVRLYLYQRTGVSFRQMHCIDVQHWRDIPLRVTALPCQRAGDVVAAHQLCLFLESLLAPLFLMAVLAAVMEY